MLGSATTSTEPCMSNPTPMTLDQVRTLLANDTPLTPEEVTKVLRFLLQGQTELEGRARQLKSSVSRLGR